jgi:hypothetical protein
LRSPYLPIAASDALQIAPIGVASFGDEVLMHD